jgi:hypothetical protein
MTLRPMARSDVRQCYPVTGLSVNRYIQVGLGRSVALCYRPSTLYQIH